MSHKKGAQTGRIFKNPVLEALSRTSPALTLGGYLPPVFFLIYVYFAYHSPYLGIANGIMMFFGGFLFWTFFEYIAHRYIFHWINDSAIVKRMHYIMHGYHHDHPRDEARLFMPPWAGWVIIGVLYLSQIFILKGYTYAFLPGMLIGYLCYVFVHYSTHKYKAPRPLKYLWKHHSLHHYKYPDKAFGVSSPLWDIVFGTMPPRQDRREGDMRGL